MNRLCVSSDRSHRNVAAAGQCRRAGSSRDRNRKQYGGGCGRRGATAAAEVVGGRPAHPQSTRRQRVGVPRDSRHPPRDPRLAARRTAAAERRRGRDQLLLEERGRRRQPRPAELRGGRALCRRRRRRGGDLGVRPGPPGRDGVAGGCGAQRGPDAAASRRRRRRLAALPAVAAGAPASRPRRRRVERRGGRGGQGGVERPPPTCASPTSSASTSTRSR